jgi:transglutaminase-like putative cysteine protease
VTSGGIPDPAIKISNVSQKSYHATVSITRFDLTYLPFYQRLSSTQKLDGSWLYDLAGDQVFSARSNSKNKNYSFDYLATEYSPAALASSPPLDPQSQFQQYAKVPQQQPVPVEDKVRELTQGKTTPYDKVLAILRFFSAANGFRYTLSTKHGTSGSDLVDFLTNKEGYCQQYAVAMAWMVRTAHLPARVAFGFTQGTRLGQTYTLSSLDLHAWTEVYFAGIGWVPFDPTPARSGSVKTDWAPDADKAPPISGSDPGSVTSNPSTDASGNPGLAPHDPRDRDPGTGSSAAGKAQPATWPWWLLGSVLTLLALACVPALRRAGLRRRRSPGRAREQPGLAVDAAAPPGEMAVVVSPAVAAGEAHAAWEELVDTLVDYDVPISDSHTPRVVVRRVARDLALTGPPSEALRLLGQAEEQARYARTPVVSGNLAAALRAVRRAVALTTSRRVRLRAAIFPPSVLQRWRERLGTAGAGVVNRVGRIGDTVGATLSPRRLLPRRSSR